MDLTDTLVRVKLKFYICDVCDQELCVCVCVCVRERERGTCTCMAKYSYKNIHSSVVRHNLELKMNPPGDKLAAGCERKR